MTVESKQGFTAQIQPVSNGEALSKIFNIDDNIEVLPVHIQTPIMLFKSPEEKMVALWTMLVISGTFFPNAWVNHRDKINYLPLMLFVVGPPSSGKGALAMLKRVTKRINEYLREEYNNQYKKYMEDLKAYKEAAANGSIIAEPVKPKLKMVEIPANITSSKLMEQMSDNGPNCSGLIVEGEIDAFGLSAKNNHGVMNTMIMRQAFHHEALSLSRKTNNEHINIQTPKIAFALSGTFNQLKNMVPSNEDGTFSRFLILQLPGSLTWSDVTPTKGQVPIDSQLDALAETYLNIFKIWRGKNIEVTFTKRQYDRINEFGTTNMNDSHHLGDHAPSLVKRHSLMLMRIAATLTMLRNSDVNPTVKVIPCNDMDFDTAYRLAECSLEHSLELFQKLPGERPKKDNNKGIFLQSLPNQFNFATALKSAGALSIPLPPARRTVERWLSNLVTSGELIRTQTDFYIKQHVAAVAVAVNNHQYLPTTTTNGLNSSTVTATTATSKFSLS